MAAAIQEETRHAGAAPALKRALWGAAALLALLLFYAQGRHVPGLTEGLFVRQDQPVLLAVLLLMLTLPLLARGRVRALPDWISSRKTAFAAAALLTLLLWAGTHVVMGDYPFTRDEQMAVFDSAIFSHLRTSAALPPQWRVFAPAMEPLYAMTFPGNAAWASAYLPGNSALRALFATVADPALLNPLLAGLGAALVHFAARRLFPTSRSAQAAALLVYLTSAQMAAAAMTPFAMTAHMTFNLLWLALFLRGGRLGHGLAGATGFVATGLHQIIFHPLFVLPFLEQLRRRGEWRTACFYLAVYAAAGLFWMSYPHWVVTAASGSAAASSGTGGFMHDRVLPLLLSRDPETLPLMAFNLLRFVAWQNPALLPLVFCAWGAVRKGEGVAPPLLAGILLTVAAMLVLLPFQSIGWGYRYLHGLLGSFALLAGYGWQRVETDRLARPLLVAGSLAVLLATGPWLLWQTRAIVAPSRAADRAIAALHADFVVIDPPGLAADQVRNDPWLANRPLRFSSDRLTPVALDILCARGKVAFVDRAALQRLGLGAYGDPAPQGFQALRARAAARSCLGV